MAGTASYELSAESKAYKRHLALTDSGAMCRLVLGWNYDEDEHGDKINLGTGGVRSDGAHLRITKFLDDPRTHFKLLEAPRGSLKSTQLQGLVCRQIALNSNVRILYGMKTDAKAAEKAMAIRNSLESPEFVELFGPQKGMPWEGASFTVCGRTQRNLQEPTFSTFSLENIKTGGHYDYIIVDDLIDVENCRTKEAVEWSKKIRRLLFPLLAGGGYLIFVGTRYGQDDMYSDIEALQTYDKLILGAGVRVVKTDQRGLDLELAPEGLTFPHLTLAKLRNALDQMSTAGNFFEFSCQYLNVVPSGMSTAFTRSMFRPRKFDAHDMRGFSGYLLTDTATSLKEEGCYSVLLYVLLDEQDTIYLADARVGHWRPYQLVDEFFGMLSKWQPLVNHVGEVWEQISLVTVFQDMIMADSRRQKLRVNSITVPRAAKDHKHARIERMERPMLRRQFYVLDTVPRTYVDLDGPKVFYDAEGYRDGRTGEVLPAGELVDEFVHLRSHTKDDVADALALIVETNRITGTRACSYRPIKKHVQERRRPDLTQDSANPSVGPSWWQRTLKGIRDDQRLP